MGRHVIRLRDRLRSRAAVVATAVAVAGTLLAVVGTTVLVDGLDDARPGTTSPSADAGGQEDRERAQSASSGSASPDSTRDEATVTVDESEATAATSESRRGDASSTAPETRSTPSPSPAPPSPSPTPAVVASEQSGVLSETNAQRTVLGVPALVWDSTLASRACTWASQLATADEGLSHSADAGGFSAWGENVASGYGSVVAVVAGWVDSEAHRANILNADFSLMGACSATSGGGNTYWVQQFGA